MHDTNPLDTKKIYVNDPLKETFASVKYY